MKQTQWILLGLLTLSFNAAATDFTVSKSNEKYARWAPEDGRLCGVAFANRAKSGSGSDQPKTGDDSGLERYLLIAILSSAGLFALSVFYYFSVKRELEQKRLS